MLAGLILLGIPRSARRVLKMLTTDQKKSTLDISKFLLALYGDDPEEFMHRGLTQDETSRSF